MPRKKLSINKTSTNKLEFIGRESLIKNLYHRVIKTTNDQYCVDVIHGMGGVGKSRLLEEFEKYLSERTKRIVPIKVDFRLIENRNLSKALILLRSQLDIPFPFFDLTFATYWKLLNPHLNLRKQDFKFFFEGEITGELIGFMSDIPIIGMAAKLPRLINKTGKETKKWWTKGSNSELKKILTFDNPSEILEWLPVMWAHDVKNWMKQKERKIIIFLDTYEALWDGFTVDSRGIPSDNWIREFASHLEGVNLIIASQRKLDWTKHDDTWKPFIHHSQLNGLKPLEITSTLKANGLDDQEVISKIIEKSHGLPIYIQLAIRVYHDLVNQGNTIPSSVWNLDLEGMVKHFLSFKPDSLKSTLLILSVPRKFGFDLFRILTKEYNTGFQSDYYSFKNLKNFAELEENEHDEYSFHTLVKETFEQIDSQESRRNIHKFLYEYNSGKLDSVDFNKINNSEKEHLVDAIYHAKEVFGKLEFDKWFTSKIELLDDVVEQEFIIEVRKSINYFYEKEFGSRDEKTLTNRHELVGLLMSMRRYSEAELLLNEILLSAKKYFSVKSKIGLAATQTYGDLMRVKGKYSIAREKFKHVIENIEDNDDKELLTIKCSALNNLSILTGSEGLAHETSILLKEALDLSNAINEKEEDSLTIKSNYSLSLEKIEKYKEALAVAESCYALSAKVYGKTHPITLHNNGVLIRIKYANGLDEATTISELKDLVASEINILGENHNQVFDTQSLLAHVYIGHNEKRKGENLLKKILKSKVEFFGPSDSTSIGSALELAKYLVGQERFSEAENTVADLIANAEKTLDKDHPILLDAKWEFAYLLYEAKRYLESKSLMEEVLLSRRKKLGTSNSKTINSINILGMVNVSLGDYPGAESLYKESLRLRMKHFKSDIGLIASSYNNLGNLYRWIERYSDADENLRKSHQMSLSAYGENHPVVNNIFKNLALNILEMGEVNEGIGMIERLFKNQYSKSSLSDHNTAATFILLISIYKSEDKNKESEKIKELVNKDITDILVDIENFDNYSLLIAIASLFTITKDGEKAISLLQNIIKYSILKFGYTSDYTREAIAKLIDLLFDKKEYKLIPSLFDNWEELCLNIYGVHNGKFIKPFEKYCLTLIHLGELKLALENFTYLLSISKKVYGERSVEVFRTLSNCIEISIWSKKMNNAKELLDQAKNLLIDNDELGKKGVFYYYKNLSLFHESQSDLKEAEKFIHESIKVIEEEKHIDVDFFVLCLLYGCQFFHRHGINEKKEFFYQQALNYAGSASEQTQDRVKQFSIDLYKKQE